MPRTFEVVAEIHLPTYYKIQNKDRNGNWRDNVGAYKHESEAVEAAEDMALDTGRPVRVLRWSRVTEEETQESQPVDIAGMM